MEFMTGVKTTDLLELAELQNKELIGQTVKVNGAVHTIRDMGDVAFVVLRKRDGLLQCVYEEGKSGFDLKDLKEACTVEVEDSLRSECTHAASDCKMEAEHFSGCEAQHAFCISEKYQRACKIQDSGRYCKRIP